MTGFPNALVERIHGLNKDFRELRIVLPTQRAAAYVEDALKSAAEKPTWLPVFTTLNRWAEEVSGLEAADNLELKFICYQAYTDAIGSEAQDISGFFSWCDILLRDFNDVSNQLIDPQSLFRSLSAYTEIENFSFLKQPLSQKQLSYKGFWESLPTLHEKFTEYLLKAGLGYPA